MKVLLVGGGGREHALGWKLHQSPRVDELVSLPGNPGLAELGSTIEGVDPTNPGAVASVARQLGVDLCVIGPEAPLAAGVVDALIAQNIPAFGPTRAGARLESSKTYAKEVMDRAGVATAAWGSFTERDPARAYLARSSGPYVVKADGLAAGKGVLVTEDRTAAEDWIDRCLGGGFGPGRVVIEEHLAGPEVSVFAICSGTEAVPLHPARDYKRLGDGDQGPNTGGMGAYSPVDDLPPGLVDQAITEVVKPVLATMAAGGHPYSGFLYAGLVLTAAGSQVLEFNCRLGDPETQVVLPRLQTDLIDLIEQALSERLGSSPLHWSREVAVNVVVAAAGYPQNPRSGDDLTIGALPEGAMVFHAGTRREGSRLVSAGGRVLNVVGLGPSREAARATAYQAVAAVNLPGMQYRRDIGA